MHSDSRLERKTPFFKKYAFIENVYGWVFVGWVVGGTLLLNILPAFPNFYLGFTNWMGLGAPQWIGLGNYVEMFTVNRDAVNAFGRTVQFTAGSIPLSIVAGLGLALLVNQKLPGMTAFRAIYYLPVISSIVAIATVFSYLLAPRFGLINMTLIESGFADEIMCPALSWMKPCPPNWLGGDSTAMGAVILVSVYTSMGYNMVLFLAGLQGVPGHLYEAAQIDGASAWGKLRHVTLPLLTPTIFFILVLSVIGSFGVFGLVMTLTGGGPGRATEVIFFYLYDEAFNQMRFGYGAAISTVMFLIVAVLTAINWVLSTRWVFYG